MIALRLPPPSIAKLSSIDDSGLFFRREIPSSSLGAAPLPSSGVIQRKKLVGLLLNAKKLVIFIAKRPTPRAGK